MSAISHYFTTSFDVRRVEYAQDGETSSLVTANTFNGHIQQIDTELAETLNLVHSETYIVWCGKDTDVKLGDELEITGGDYAGTYTVRQKQTNAIGGNQHLELIVQTDK